MRKENHMDHIRQTRNHPIRQQITAIILGVCLTVVSIPMGHPGSMAQAAQGVQKIISFTQLPAEVKEQSVYLNTPIEKLNLPKALEADCLADQEQALPEGSLESESTEIPVTKKARFEAPSLEAETAEQISGVEEAAVSSEAGDQISEGDPGAPLLEKASESEGDIENTDQTPSGEDAGDTEDTPPQEKDDGAGQAPQPGEESPAQPPSPGEGADNHPDSPEQDNPPDAEIPPVQESVGNSQQPQQPGGNDQPDANRQEPKRQTVTIEGVSWQSQPEYNGRTKGTFVFTPILPEGYLLSEGVSQLEIKVTVKDGTDSEAKRKEEKEKKETKRQKSIGKTEQLKEEKAKQPEVFAAQTVPACGTITTDTVWSEAGVLSDGILSVEPGVTLTINNNVRISGTVTIRGGGTIVRGSDLAYFGVISGNRLALENITLEGNSLNASTAFLVINGGTAELNGGCRIQNCSLNPAQSEMGSALSVTNGNVTLNGAVITNCSASRSGGAISNGSNSTLTINGGTYENNRTTLTPEENVTIAYGGGFICNGGGSKLYINGGKFLNNTSAGRGGCIYNTGDNGTKAYLYGGEFKGNVSNCPGYEGSGAVFCSSLRTGGTAFDLSGNVQFCGDGSEDSGVDGIYLDSRNSLPRKIDISNTLSYPVKIYVKAVENYVIAVGVNDYILLHERDMKRITFVDVGNSGKKWYAVLDEKNNQVKLSPKDPGYKYYVYYISNGAKGTVVDNGKYDIDDVTKVKSPEPLQWEGHQFKEWNTEPDGKGTGYQEGAPLTIKGDTNLYAIFEEAGKKVVYAADFYSGADANKETRMVTAEEGSPSEERTVKTPKLKEMENWIAKGWNEDPDSFETPVGAETDIVLESNREFYGVYEKNIRLSYDANGGGEAPESETGRCRANVHQQITYDFPEFEIAPGPKRVGYVFSGWNTKTDGMGEPYGAGERKEFQEDTVLYACWSEEDETAYRVEHYKQDLEGEGYTKADADTQYLTGRTGSIVQAEAKSYAGFHENSSHASQKASGTVEADGSLALRLYYDRDVYEVGFDLNGGEGNVPDTQKARFGGLIKEPQEPVRGGYVFKGWHTAPDTSGSRWDFGRAVEENAASPKATLYAIWADEQAPLLGKAEFGLGYYSFVDWIIEKKKLTITVSVTEEGSGLKQGDYILVSEGGEIKKGTAQIRSAYDVGQVAVGRSGGMYSVMTVRADKGSGESFAEITIEEDFKGKVYLSCTDYAGNVSAQKVLTAEGGGVIVEDNAPEITFQAKRPTRGIANVTVTVEDSLDEKISGGIAEIFCSIDGERYEREGVGAFEKDIVESFEFQVALKGAGSHTLLVKAKDNAGNENSKETTVEIPEEKEPKTQKPPKTKNLGPKMKEQTPGTVPRPADTKPTAGEPATGEFHRVEIYATLAMVAGFAYLLSYFAGGELGITEKEKQETVSRLVRWAKGGRFRRIPALSVIFLFLAYYHFIGKKAPDEWREACEK